ncbi:MAG: chaperone NapD [Acidobacteria bacterium]|uniref:Chaperone NapD n=1 Tax=Candidatus Polarisedimenticola svalbardensis TaxID=2886004 RepID=A0A8J6Y5J3_9BACT|nr:chaperone NapD [Candidatus Polarisedimenticola svalbardensis]
MNISGILVITPAEQLQSTIDNLNALPGVEVHHTDPETGRIVVTQEAGSVHGEVDGLKRIKALPHIILAEMVHHHFEDDRQPIGRGPEIPAMLRDQPTLKES